MTILKYPVPTCFHRGKMTIAIEEETIVPVGARMDVVPCPRACRYRLGEFWVHERKVWRSISQAVCNHEDLRSKLETNAWYYAICPFEKRFSPWCPLLPMSTIAGH